MTRRRIDQPELTAEQQAMVDRNRGLAGLLARRLNSPIPVDDRVQIACMALMRAARTFDPARGTFSTYAGRVIRSYLHHAAQDYGLIRVPRYLQDRRPGKGRRFLGLADRAAHTVLFSDLDGGSDGARGRDITVAPREDDGGRVDGRIEELRDAIRELPEELRAVIDRRLRGETLKVIGRELRLSGERIRQLEEKARERLRRRMAEA